MCDAHHFNTQSYNRYSYVFNNPLSYTDPTGFSGDPKETPEEKERRKEQEKKLRELRETLIKQQKIGHPGAIKTYNSILGLTASMNGGIAGQDENGNFLVLTSNGEMNVVKVSVQESSIDGFDLLSNLVNGSGLFSGAVLLNLLSNDEQQWKGRNGKWNNINWGGNQWTGARSEILRRAGQIKAAGQGLFVLGTALSLYEGANAFADGNSYGVVKAGSDIGWGTAATFGGGVGLVGGATYFGTSLLLNIPSVRDATITPITDGLCFASGNC